MTAKEREKARWRYRRYAQQSGIRERMRANCRKHYYNNIAKERARCRKYVKDNRERCLEAGRKYREKHREKIRAKQLAKYHAMPEHQRQQVLAKARARRVAWRAANPLPPKAQLIKPILTEAELEAKRAHRAAYIKRWVEKNKKHRYAQIREWQKSHRGKYNKYARKRQSKRVAALTDGYIRRSLKAYHGIPNPTQEQIDKRRAIIATKRAQRAFKMMAAAHVISK